MVYVDELQNYPIEAVAPAARQFGTRWCHMWADDLAELHAMARNVGLGLRSFQDKPDFPHYDLVPSKRARALSLGAKEASLREHLKQMMEERRQRAVPDD